MANSGSGDAMLDRVVAVLETFSSERSEQTPAEISRRSTLPASTTYRLVDQLVTRGFLDRGSDGRLRLGLRLWELSLRGSPTLGLRELAMPYLEDVQQSLQQHTQLGVRQDGEVLIIERLSHREAGANIARIAGRLPLHASSTGLILLAHEEPAFREHYLASPLRALGPETIVEPHQLRDELARIRGAGSVVASGSVAAESTGVAVPVFSRPGVVIAALGVVLPRHNAEYESTVRVLRQAATGITRSLRAARLDSH